VHNTERKAIAQIRCFFIYAQMPSKLLIYESFFNSVRINEWLTVEILL